MSRPFTADRLRELLTDPRFVLRHDVDFSLLAALRMAELEHDLNRQATYYLMWSNPFYSAEQALLLAMALTSLGHRVGAHLDPRTQGLGQMYRKIPISFHCPRPSDLWRPHAGYDDFAYAAEWEGRYYADSRGRFAHGDPEDDPRNEPLQLNLHPEWWFAPRWLDTVDDELYERFFHEPKPLHDF